MNKVSGYSQSSLMHTGVDRTLDQYVVDIHTIHLEWPQLTIYCHLTANIFDTNLPEQHAYFAQCL